MAFPPQFLDELRGRIALVDVIGRRVRLTRKGREHSGLCPFHNEKTPSFTVSEDKGFFHCFGCGAHGDVIGFVMRAENLSFPEAIERLADEAGIAVPVLSPVERESAARQATLLQVMEAACAFFEASLHGAPREYLRGRGLDDDAIARFRLGYAPDSRIALRSALLGTGASRPLPPQGAEREMSAPAGIITEAQLVEAGLLIRPEDGGPAYDRFRGRVMFPIADRRGRVIAFGARALGDAQPKYLNSPDTPLFHKGQVLYGMATALPAARGSGRVVVAEGYMDVIALVRAGIEDAVAPLGTALTESQIELLWRMAPEPVLCFDGDTAGRRAAFRAAERALPLLRPGLSLRFVALPPGEDPDTLIARHGRAAMDRLLDGARPLDRVVWEMECAGQPLDTPERVAGLEQRLEQRARAIADARVQYQYLAAFRRRLREAAWQARGPSRPGRGGPGNGARPAGRGSFAGGRPPALVLPARSLPETGAVRREQAALATVINHWALLDEFAEALGTLRFFDPVLDKLRQALLSLYAASPDLDSDAVARHLLEAGCSEGVKAVLSPGVFVSARSARADAAAETARTGLSELILGMRLDDAQRQYEAQPTEENLARLLECRDDRHRNLRQSV